MKSTVLTPAQSRALYELAEPGVQPNHHTGMQLCELGLASYLETNAMALRRRYFALTSKGWARLGIGPERKAF